MNGEENIKPLLFVTEATGIFIGHWFKATYWIFWKYHFNADFPFNPCVDAQIRNWDLSCESLFLQRRPVASSWPLPFVIWFRGRRNFKHQHDCGSDSPTFSSRDTENETVCPVFVNGVKPFPQEPQTSTDSYLNRCQTGSRLQTPANKKLTFTQSRSLKHELQRI